MLGLFAVACGRDPIKVSELKEGSNDFGQRDLEKAITDFTQNRTSAAGYRQMMVKIAVIEPYFNQTIRESADRYIAFLSESVLTPSLELPPRKRVEELALTVWPTALGVEPKSGETVDAYIERVCVEALPLLCKQIVPEHRSAILHEEVWDRMQSRARKALHACIKCRDDATFHQTLDKLNAGHVKAREELTQVQSESSPRAWPRSGVKAAAWTAVPTLIWREDGVIRLSGEELPTKGWEQALRTAREVEIDGQRSDTLGVHLRPNTRVEVLVEIVRVAKNAGFSQLLLQAREQKLPYTLKAYALKLSGNGVTVSIRPDETVQTLIEGLDRFETNETPRLQIVAGKSLRFPSSL